jgi:hypothetical protein
MAKIDIEARIKRLEEQLKSARSQKAKAKAVREKKESKKQNKKDILYAIYRRKLHSSEYEKDISSPDFNKFLVRDYERELFGLPPLEGSVVQENPSAPVDFEASDVPASVETNTSIVSTEETPDRMYIKVDIQDKEVAKKHGAQWDAVKRCWYVPKGIDSKAILRAIDEAKSRKVADL